MPETEGQLLTIQVVGWNSAKTLPATVAALAKLPRDKVAVRYIDNASTDESVRIVRTGIPWADVLPLSKNFGFIAHNKGLALCHTPFVMLHDPDLTVLWSGLERVLHAFQDKQVGAVQGLVLRAEQRDGEDVIDSAGIELSSALNGVERGSNELNVNQYEARAQVIAVTGAAALYRMSALDKVAHRDGEVLDADFFAYKEDVDLGWRLTRSNFKVLYIPVTFARHHRTLGRRGVFNWGLKPITVYKRLRSARTYYSLRNWIWMITKNASSSQLAVRSPFVTARALVLLLFSLLYPPLLLAWAEAIKGLPRMLAKRR